MPNQQIDFIVKALSRNLLSADEFQRLFITLSRADRMILLQRLDEQATPVQRSR
jgi:hypothetical protein